RGPAPARHYPTTLTASSAGLLPPSPEGEAEAVNVVRGPNIKEVPRGRPVEATLRAAVLIKLGDKVSTDDISPSGTAALVHRSNLTNWGLLPLEFDDPADYEAIQRDDMLRFDDLRDALHAGRKIAVTNERTGATFNTRCVLTTRERDILLAGGLLAQTAMSP